MNPEAIEWTVIIAAVAGYFLHLLVDVRNGIKTNPESPDKFSFQYYFTRPLNIVNLLINGMGSFLLLLGRHEVVDLLEFIPFLQGTISPATPVLLGGSIGFGGGWAVSKATRLMTKDEPAKDE